MTNHQKSEDTRTVELITARYLKLCRIRKRLSIFFYFKKEKKKTKNNKAESGKTHFFK